MSGHGVAARQMVLAFAHPASYAADDFLVSPANAAAHATILSWPHWPSRTLILLGPPGAGKSHLATIWAERAGAAPIALDRLREPTGPVLGLIEDADRELGPEAAFFHLLNMVDETGGWLVMTARTPPDNWGIRTPDLLSRLRRAPTAAVGSPDETLVQAVLFKLFTDRQIRVDADVVAYAALHLERSLEAVARFVAAVDDAALAEGRRITRPLIAQTLAMLAHHDPKAGART